MEDISKLVIAVGRIVWFVTVGWLLTGLYLLAAIVGLLVFPKFYSNYDSPDNKALANIDNQNTPFKRAKRIVLFKFSE
jgi:hypothetical protein